MHSNSTLWVPFLLLLPFPFPRSEVVFLFVILHNISKRFCFLEPSCLDNSKNLAPILVMDHADTLFFSYIKLKRRFSPLKTRKILWHHSNCLNYHSMVLYNKIVVIIIIICVIRIKETRVELTRLEFTAIRKTNIVSQI